MKFKNSIATVISLNYESVTVRLTPADRFSSCAEKGCHLCSGPTKPKELTVAVANHSFSIGDRVVVSIPTINEALATGIVFIFPILISLSVATTLLIGLGWLVDSPAFIGSVTLSFMLSFLIPPVVDHLLKRRYPIRVVPFEKSCA